LRMMWSGLFSRPATVEKALQCKRCDDVKTKFSAFIEDSIISTKFVIYFLRSPLGDSSYNEISFPFPKRNENEKGEESLQPLAVPFLTFSMLFF
jgi:hypothetical protein